MNVEQLIKALEVLPKDAKVYHLWDGAARTRINFVWLSKDGNVVTSDYEMVCYDDASRPINAPTNEQDPYWKTDEDPDPMKE